MNPPALLAFAARSISALLVLIASAGSAADLPVVAWQGRTMGSDYTVRIVGTNLAPEQIDALKAEVDQQLKEVTAKWNGGYLVHNITISLIGM